MLRRIWRYTERFLSVWVCHVIVAQVLYWRPSRTPLGDSMFSDTLFADAVMAAVCLVTLAVLVYQLNKISMLYDDEMRARLYADGVRQHTRRERLRFLFSQRRLWLERAVLTAAYLFLPLTHTWSVLGDFVLGGNETLLRKVYLFLPLAVVCLLLGTAARMRAMEQWYWHERGEQKLYDTKKKRKNPSNRAFDGAVIGTTFSALVVGGVAGIVIPALVGYLPALLVLFTSRAAVAVLAVIVVWCLMRALRRLHRRRRFLKRLHTLCAAKGYTIEESVRPYRSLFTLYDGENLRINAAGRLYSVKFLSGKSRRKPLVLHEDGVCEFLTIVRFARAEVTRLSRAYDCAWESAGYKILLLDPVPYKVMNVRAEELDNGSTVGGYKIFTGTAFLNALERECVERNG